MFDIILQKPSATFNISLQPSNPFGFITVSGAYKEITNAYIAVSGEWKEVTDIFITNNQVWKTLV